MYEIKITCLPCEKMVIRKLLIEDGTAVRRGDVICEVDADDLLGGVVVEVPALASGGLHWLVKAGSVVDTTAILGTIEE